MTTKRDNKFIFDRMKSAVDELTDHEFENGTEIAVPFD